MALKHNNLEIIFSKKDLDLLITKIKEFLKPGTVLALSGPMGAGKTTLSRALIQSFGVKDIVSSPTYSYLNRYKASFNDKDIMINHADLYRVKVNQLEDLGIIDYIFSSSDISIVEWPDILDLANKTNVLKITIDYVNEKQRKIIINKYE